ncbi:hypothetical protein [Tenggerimyces flavus]|uniref:hypothetical protein n=1 Tax=Tenggerimyces flavus TaxID=1708749 RepID=UPI0036DD8E93|nr:hypothetical protein [Tenggerimyces flavus]
MSAGTTLAEAVLDARDVVETYRDSAVLLSDWQSLLLQAAEVLTRQSSDIDTPPEAETATELRMLAAGEIETSPELVERTALRLRHLVVVTRPSGVPHPEDDDWAF